MSENCPKHLPAALPIPENFNQTTNTIYSSAIKNNYIYIRIYGRYVSIFEIVNGTAHYLGMSEKYSTETSDHSNDNPSLKRGEGSGLSPRVGDNLKSYNRCPECCKGMLCANLFSE